MIRRDAGDVWLLIPQPSHARLAGELAARWSQGAVFPREAVVYGTAHHDDGWIEWERAPRADPATGEPVDFLHLRAEEHLAIWRRGPALVAARDPYAGILVSRHGSALTAMALERDGRTADERAAFEAYLGEQAAFRARLARDLAASAPGLRPALAGEVLERNVALLQVLDFLSLVLCMGAAGARTLASPGTAQVRLFLRPAGEGRVALAPWPFEGDEVRARVEARRLPKTRYDDASLCRALERAPPETIPFVLAPGG